MAAGRDLLEAVIAGYRRHAEPRAQVVDCSLRDIPVLEPRPLDASLDSSRFAAAFDCPFGDPGSVAAAAVDAYFAGARAGC